MDISMPVRTLPEAGETVLCEGSVAYSPGGKGANSAVTFAALGAETVFCARIGRDSHGESLYDFYKEKGIDTRHLILDREHATGCAVILLARKGQNRIMCYPGANKYLNENDVEDAFLCCPDALYMQMEIGQDALLAAADYAHRHEIPIFLDAGPARADFPLESLPPVTVFSPNETETEIYTGRRLTGTDSMLAASMDLLRRVRAEYIVLKLGDRGAFVCNGRHFKFISAFPIRAVDTTAAGDAFTAALTIRYLENGGDINDAVRYGCAAGAITASRAGAAYAVPQSVAEMAEFLAGQEADL
jgi:ribokinase